MSDETPSFIKMVPVVDIRFLDISLTAPLYRKTSQQYISWNTGSSFSGEERDLNNALLLKGVPPNTYCLLKMY